MVDRGIYAVNFGGGQVDITSGSSCSRRASVSNRGRVRRRAAQGCDADRQRPTCSRASRGSAATSRSTAASHLRQGRAVGAVGVGLPTLRIDDLTVGAPRGERSSVNRAARARICAARGRRRGRCRGVESDSLEARVRGDEIDFVKQARERKVGRARARARRARHALGDHLDERLSEPALGAVAAEAVALARAHCRGSGGRPARGRLRRSRRRARARARRFPLTAACAPSADRCRAPRRARRARGRSADRELGGSSASASFARVAYASSAGFAGDYSAASHSLFAEPIAREWRHAARLLVHRARSLAGLESPEAVGRRAAERALRRLGARKVATCEVPVIFDPLTAASLWSQVAGLVSGYAVYRGTTISPASSERSSRANVTLVDDGCVRPASAVARSTVRAAVAAHRGDRARPAGLVPARHVLRAQGRRPIDRQRVALREQRARRWRHQPRARARWREPRPDHRRHAARPARDGADRNGLQSHDGDYSRGAAGLWIEAAGSLSVEEVTIAGTSPTCCAGSTRSAAISCGCRGSDRRACASRA